MSKMASFENNKSEPPTQELGLFLERIQIEPKLSTEPMQAIPQLRQALYGLIQFAQEVGRMRNQLLGQAFDRQKIGNATTIIDLDPTGNLEELVKLAEAPISGWDFTAGATKDEAGQQIFEPEFVARVAYLLGEVVQGDPDNSAHAALLSVDRLDLLLTLARSEAQRLADELGKLAGGELT